MTTALILTVCLQWIAIVFLTFKYRGIAKVVNAHTEIMLHSFIKICEERELYELAKILKVNWMDTKIKNLFLQGFKLREISEMTGVNIKNIEYIVYSKFNLPRRRKPSSNINESRILHLTKWGYGPEEISVGEGIKLKTVKRVLNGKNESNSS